MPITAEYDQEADALYVRLTESERSRAVEIDDATFVDLASDQTAVGIEFLYASHGLNLDEVARRFSLEPHVPAIIGAIAAARGPVPNPTATAGQVIASTANVMVAVEGTIAAGQRTPLASEAHGEYVSELVTV
jgi:uncharacterized protein YuzE